MCGDVDVNVFVVVCFFDGCYDVFGDDGFYFDVGGDLLE